MQAFSLCALVVLVGCGSGGNGVQSRIAFASDRDGNNEIYMMNAGGTNQTRLTNNAASDGDPAFSADGTKIGFNSQRDGN